MQQPTAPKVVPRAPAGPAPAAQMRTVQVTPESAAAGKALFAACAGCHGAQGEGKVGQGPRLNSDTFLAAASDELLRKTISQGRPGTTMIPWGASFSVDQVDALISHLRTLNPVAPATLNEARLNADLENGKKLYQSICYTCHGRTGAGYQETANGTGIGRKAFLSTVSNGYVRYLVKHGKSQTQMRPFAGAKVSVAALNPREIDDVIGYLRSQAW